MDQLNDNLHYATSTAEGALSQLIADSEGAMAGANDDRKQWMSDLTVERTREFQAVVDSEKDKVNAWFDDQAEWAEKLYDSYYKEHLLQTLQSRRDATLEALDGRAATSRALADAANAQLADNLDAEEDALHAFSAATLHAMEQFDAELEAATAAAAAATNDAFSAAADAENAGKQAFLDDMTQTWAYWIKYLFGYSGYDTALYADYDDTFDYSDGAFSDFGYQGNGPQQSGGASQGNGFGYGGIGGTDYLDSGDAAGLAYGSFTGPDPKYFDDFITDSADELTTLLEGYSASYGKRYW
jgi:hypothetical protein